MHEKFEKEAIKLIKKYQKLLFLDIHNITLKHDPEIKEGFAMEIEPRYPYLSGDITYNDKAIKRWQEGDLEEYICHELIHIITAPLDYVAKKRSVTEDEINETEERLTDTITRIVLNLVRQL